MGEMVCYTLGQFAICMSRSPWPFKLNYYPGASTNFPIVLLLQGHFVFKQAYEAIEFSSENCPPLELEGSVLGGIHIR